MINQVYGEDNFVIPSDYQAYQDPDHFSDTIYLKSIQEYGEFSYIADLVLFPPGAYKNYHIHQVQQTLYVTSGQGWYQEKGKTEQVIKKGDIIHIPGGVKHWHGAAANHWLEHIAIEDVSKGAPEWFERLDIETYHQLHQ